MHTLSTLTLLAAATVALHAAGFTDIHPAANPSNSTWTNGVSSDGLVSVGRSNIGGGAKAYKIVGGTYTQLNNLSGGSGSWATAASSTSTQNCKKTPPVGTDIKTPSPGPRSFTKRAAGVRLGSGDRV